MTYCPPPCQGNTFEIDTSAYNFKSSGGAQGSESPPALHYHYDLARRDHIIEWQQFHNFLLQRMTPKTAEDRLRYAKQYASVLTTTSYGIPKDLLQLSPNKRIHVMKALSCLAKYTGMQDHWLAIRKRYGLQWSTGTERSTHLLAFLTILAHWIQCCIGSMKR
jgi:hypothetical protein